MTSPTGTIEFDQPYGGDFVQTPDGDIATINDRDNDGEATAQRIDRLLMQCAVLKDASGSPVGRPDDFFNPFRGANGRRAVGKLITNELINSTYAQIADGLKDDPGILHDPPPSITVQDGGNGVLLLGPVSVVTVLGNLVTVPSRKLVVYGSTS